MKCKNVHKNLSAYTDGEIPTKLRERIERHLRLCERCSAELSRLQRVSKAAESSVRKFASSRRPPSDLKERVMQAIEPVSRRRVLLIPARRLAAQAVGIALVSGLLVATALRLHFHSERQALHRKVAEQARALALAENDSKAVRAALQHARASLSRAQEALRLAYSSRLETPEAPSATPVASRPSWPPVFSSLGIRGAEGLLKNGFF